MLNGNSSSLPCDSKRMHQSVIMFITSMRIFFPKMQPYSAVRMDKSSHLENAITTESLLELDSVLDTSLNDWNEELSTGPNKMCRSAWQLTVNKHRAHALD